MHALSLHQSGLINIQAPVPSCKRTYLHIDLKGTPLHLYGTNTQSLHCKDVANKTLNFKKGHTFQLLTRLASRD
jgi:hypothetical protein